MSEADQLGPSYDASVVLDIGDDIGALIITTSPDLHLVEIEISPVDDGDAPDHDHEAAHAHDHEAGHAHSHAHRQGKRTHVAVRERRGPSGVRYAAIYPELHEGTYTIYDAQGQPTDTARIVGGEITELDWR